MTDETLNQLNEITEISFKIAIIYNGLILLEIFKDINDNYLSQKKTFLEQLQILLEDEKEAYSFFESDLYQVEELLEFLQRKQNQDVSEKERLVQNRILNKLKAIELQCAIESKDEDCLEEFYADLFLDSDISIADLISIIEGLTLPMEDSLNRHFVSTLNEAIKNPCNYTLRRHLISAKYDFIYEHSGSIEQECLTQGFNYNLKMDLREETALPEIDPKTKSDYLKKYIKNKLLDMLIVCGSCTELDMAIPEIAWFKTYLLYLSDSDVEEIKTRVSDYYFQNDEIKETLQKALKDINVLRAIHNKKPNEKSTV